MPRQAHGRPLNRTEPSKSAKGKSAKGRGLNALQIAEEENPEEIKIRQHRLGESYDDPDEPNSRTEVDERSSKRRKVTHGDDAEESESGSDLDGERWHVGVEENDEDSDIESDDAFGESDEERFADFTFRGSKGNARTPRGAPDEGRRDDVEDGPESEDDLGEGAVDLATALDMNEEADDEQPSRKKKKRRRSVTPEDNSDGSDHIVADETEDSDDEADQDSELSVSDQEDGDHDRLQSFVQSLSTKQQPSKGGRDEKSASAPTKISAADLLQYVKDPQQRQSLKILQNNEVKAPEPYKGGIPGRLAPPLAKRQQDRLDRVAAYDESKKELGKWVETVKQNRRAEHLVFPLVDPDSAASKNDQLAPISQSQYRSSLESKIQDIMQESGLSGQGNRSAEQEEQAFEELQEKKMPLVEVQARRAALRQARDLMFREEIRAKRIKKIKSRAYRRIHRKERDRATLREKAEMTAEGLVDSEEEREKNDRRRAEERMGARHRESKWAKAVKATGRAAWDEDARGGVSDLARRDEQLRRRIEGKDTNGSGFSDSDSESDGYDSGVDVQDLEDRLAAVEATESTGATSRLESMAFMKRAEAGQKAMNDAAASELRQQRRGEVHNESSDSSDSNMLEGGRQKYGAMTDTVKTQPAKTVFGKSEFEERLSEDEDEEADLQEATVPSAPIYKPISAQARHPHNAKDTTKNALRQPDLHIHHGNSIQQPSQTSKSKKSLPAKPLGRPSKQQVQILEVPETTSNSDPSDQQQEPTTPNPSSHEPRTLSEAVFFGDDSLLPTFAAEKSAAIASEDDQPLDDPNALPGWGSWTGAGISKKAQKRAANHAKGKSNSKNAVVKGVRPDQRQDRGLDRVIINEKTIKKNNRYLATELPHPFENRVQYERSLRVPVGPEWTTKRDFQDGVKPRVLMRQGVVGAIRRPVV